MALTSPQISHRLAWKSSLPNDRPATSHFLKIHLHIHFPSPRSYQRIGSGPKHQFIFRNMIHFYSEELSAPRPTPKLEHHSLSAVRDRFFNIFAATLHIGGRSSIRNPRTRHAVVTGTHLSRILKTETKANCTLCKVHWSD